MFRGIVLRMLKETVVNDSAIDPHIAELGDKGRAMGIQVWRQ
jgi:hypothetical protein